MKRAVFLDRDGVLNESIVVDGKSFPPRSLAEFVMTEGAKEQMARLRRHGFLLIGVTNQPDISTGLVERSTVDAINSILTNTVGIEEIYVCAHTYADDCDCRKPKDGSFRDAAAKYDIDLKKSWTIGDRWVDIEAGRRAGVRTVLLERAYSWMPTSSGAPEASLRPDFVGKSLEVCVDRILDAETSAGVI